MSSESSQQVYRLRAPVSGRESIAPVQDGVVYRDAETGESFSVNARCVVNATGVWVDAVRDMDRDADAPARPAMVAPSQGVHLVVDRAFLPGTHALMVPKTADGRVLFAVPWLGKTILGTTDTPRHDLAAEPEPFDEDGTRVIAYPGDERHPERVRAMPGPTRLAYREGRFEPAGGFEAFFA